MLYLNQDNNRRRERLGRDTMHLDKMNESCYS